MANIFLNLPAPAGNGVGTAVDTSTLGRDKTITIGGTFAGVVIIEFSNEGAAGPWGQVASFQSGAKIVVPVAALFMRVRRASVPALNPGLPNVDVGANDNGALFLDLPATAGDGTGASVDVSTLGTFNTVCVLGTFAGTVVVEISEDGVDFAECMVFNNPGFQSKVFTAQFMRVRRKNVPAINPGLPNIDVGAINDAAAAAVSAPRTVFVFRPGGTAGGNVYTDWDTLVAALATVPGRKTIQFIDLDNGKPIVIPAGGPYDMTDVLWFASRAEAFDGIRVDIQIDEGVTFTNLRFFEGVLIDVRATATIPDESLRDNDLISLNENAAVKRNAPGAVPMWRSTNFVATDRVTVLLENNSSFLGAGALIDMSVTGTTLQFNCQVNTTVQANVVSGVAGTTLNLLRLASASFVAVSQPSWLGTINDSVLTSIRMSMATAAVAGNQNPFPNDVKRFDTTASNRTANLPAAASSFAGRGSVIGIINEAGANNVVVTAAGGDTVEGGASQNVGPGARALYMTDGVSAWFRMALG